jgi:hypothetical protein
MEQGVYVSGASQVVSASTPGKSEDLFVSHSRPIGASVSHYLPFWSFIWVCLWAKYAVMSHLTNQWPIRRPSMHAAGWVMIAHLRRSIPGPSATHRCMLQDGWWSPICDGLSLAHLPPIDACCRMGDDLPSATAHHRPFATYGWWHSITRHLQLERAPYCQQPIIIPCPSCAFRSNRSGWVQWKKASERSWCQLNLRFKMEANSCYFIQTTTVI